MDKFYTPKELARLLNVGHRTILNLIKSGRIRAVNLGIGDRNIYQIYDGELQRFIAEEYEKSSKRN